MGIAGLNNRSNGQQYLGVRESISMGGPLEFDVVKTQELEKCLAGVGLYESQEKAVSREEVLGKLDQEEGSSIKRTKASMSESSDNFYSMSESLDNNLESILYVDCSSNDDLNCSHLNRPPPSKPSPSSLIAHEWRRANHDVLVDNKQDKTCRASDVPMLKTTPEFKRRRRPTT